jgi:hypothetical protein
VWYLRFSKRRAGELNLSLGQCKPPLLKRKKLPGPAKMGAKLQKYVRVANTLSSSSTLALWTTADTPSTFLGTKGSTSIIRQYFPFAGAWTGPASTLSPMLIAEYMKGSKLIATGSNTLVADDGPKLMRVKLQVMRWMKRMGFYGMMAEGIIREDTSFIFSALAPPYNSSSHGRGTPSFPKGRAGGLDLEKEDQSRAKTC